MARRGRPATKRIGPDVGTPELARKRLEALGAPRAGWPVPDTADAENALGTLLWGGWLHPQYEAAKRMHDAGVEFAGWWMLVHPKCNAQGTLGRLQPGSSGEEIDPERAEENLRGAKLVLGTHWSAVVDVCVYRKVSLTTIQDLRRGLAALIRWQRGKNVRGAA